MSLFSLFRIVFSVCLVGFASAAAAESRMKICNRGKETIQLAVLEEVPAGFLATKWEASGWFKVSAGSCSKSSSRPGHQMVFLSVLGLGRDKPRILDYGVDRLPSRLGKSKSYGVERFYCVKSGSFRRTLKDIKMHGGRCPNGYYKQLFNNFVWVAQNTNFTLSIK